MSKDELGLNWDGGGEVRGRVAMVLHAGAATMKSLVETRPWVYSVMLV